MPPPPMSSRMSTAPLGRQLGQYMKYMKYMKYMDEKPKLLKMTPAF